MDKVVPRVMFVDSLGTSYENPNAPEQLLGLTLLDREASRALSGYLSSKNRPGISQLLSCSHNHTLDRIGGFQSSFRHKRDLLVKGNKYHLGDVITEREAYVLGYPEPHLDTEVIRMTQLILEAKDESELTSLLREEELIAPYEVAIKHSKISDFNSFELHVVKDSYEQSFRAERFKGSNCLEHPTTLLIFNPHDKVRSIFASMYQRDFKTIFEFMTSIDLK